MKLVLVAAALVIPHLYAASLNPEVRQLSRDILRELIDTNTTDSAGSTTAAAEAMARRFHAAGFPAADVTVLGPRDRKGNLVVRLRGANTAGRKPILIICHVDVVEARPADWTTNPFQLVEKDGYFYGRGTQDMKASDAILVTTFLRFQREGFKPNRDLILALTADEEGGSANGVDWLLRNHRDLVDAEYALNPDSGGVVTLEGKPLDVEIEAAEKLYADFRISATNPGGHSSLPVPDNAIYRVTDALGRLEHSAFPFELNPVTRAYFERLSTVESKRNASDMRAILKDPPDADALARLSHVPQFNSMLRTTCVATRLSGGHANNALPQRAEAVVNCRILPGHTAEEVRQALIAIVADPRVTIRYESNFGQVSDRAPDRKSLPPVAPRADVLEALERVAAAMWPGAPVVPNMEVGASDSIYTLAAGIPTYGVSGLAIDRNDIRAHGKDERIRVTAYDDGVEFYYTFLKTLTAAR